MRAFATNHKSKTPTQVISGLLFRFADKSEIITGEKTPTFTDFSSDGYKINGFFWKS